MIRHRSVHDSFAEVLAEAKIHTHTTIERVGQMDSKEPKSAEVPAHDLCEASGSTQ